MAWADEFNSLEPRALLCHKIVLAALDASKTGAIIRRNEHLRVPLGHKPHYMRGGLRQSTSIIGELYNIVCKSREDLHRQQAIRAANVCDVEMSYVSQANVAKEFENTKGYRTKWLTLLNKYFEDLRQICLETKDLPVRRKSRISELKNALKMEFYHDADELAEISISDLKIRSDGELSDYYLVNEDICHFLKKVARQRLAAQIYVVNYLNFSHSFELGIIKTLVCYEICGYYILANKVKSIRKREHLSDKGAFSVLEEQLYIALSS